LPQTIRKALWHVAAQEQIIEILGALRDKLKRKKMGVEKYIP